MDSFVITPTSEAESQLLAALFQKMRLKVQVVAAPAKPRRRTKQPAAATKFVPQNAAEEHMLEAVLELKEVLAGRKQALTVEEFWAEVHEG